MNNPRIIHAPMNRRRYAETSPITQYDYGYLLLPEGVELPTTYEIDFSNDEKHGTSFTVYGNSEGAEVPEVLIRTGKDVFAFYYRVGDGYGKTDHTWRIPNHCRPDRDGETPTPSQQSSIDQLIVRSNEAVESAEQSAEDASASAQNASADAERAEEARTDAQNYANNAQTSANNASVSASQASASASASAQSASDAETARQAATSLVAEAQRYANASEQTAQASATSASQAQWFAQSASASAQSASGYATQADISANTASNKASEASTSAQTASNKASEASQSASQALTYKTDAETAKTASQTAQGLAESARDTAVQAKEDAESARDEAQNLVDGISGKVEQIESNTERIESLEDDRYKPYVTDSASGSIASFSDGADGIPLKSLVVNIDPIQDLHGQDAPYPAGGGKNLLIQMPQETTVINGVTWTINSDGSISANGTASGASTFNYISSEQGVEFNGDYKYLQFPAVAPQVMGIGIKLNKWVAVYPNVVTSITGVTGKIIQMWFQIKDGQTANNITFYPMIYKASEETPTAWSPYENICPISGWTEAEVKRTGKNLFSYDSAKATTGTTTAGTIRAYYPLGVSNCTLSFSAELIDSGSVANTYINIGKLKDGKLNVLDTFIMPSGITERTLMFSENEQAVLMTSATSVASIIINFPKYRICVTTGSTPQSYEPYTGRSITIDLGQTVYGGHLDVLSGVLTVDRYFIDPSQWTQYNASNGYKAYRIQHIPNGRYGNDAMNKPISNMIAKFGGFSSSAMSKNIIQPPRINADTAYLALQDGIDPTTVELSYLIANPFTIQLTPNQVNSLLGVNNIWADSGNTEVVYRADTKAYIAKKIAEAISALS